MNNVVKINLPIIALVVGLASALLTTTANAGFIINFGTDKDVGDFNISEAARESIGATHQVEVKENAVTAGLFDFVFTNGDITYDSVIADIYFGKAPTFGDDFTFYDFTASTGNVAFSVGASPSDPPPNGPNNVFASFAADSDSPVITKGIGNGESLTVSFTSTKTIAQIKASFLSGDYQIATHVQSIQDGEGGQSQYFVSNLPDHEGNFGTDSFPIPEPGSLTLFALGALGIGWSRRYAMRARK